MVHCHELPFHVEASIRRQLGTSWMPEAQTRPWVSKMTFAVWISTSPKRDALCNGRTAS